MAERDKHVGAYPDETPPIYLAYAFRPFFLALPFYLTLLVVLWGLVYAGAIALPVENVLIWHVYELLYGIGAAAVGAFMLTALPEFFPGVMPVIGRRLAAFVGLWVAARIAFWGMALWGAWPAFVLNALFMAILIGWVAGPILADPLKRHRGLFAIVGLLLALQIGFFLALIGFASFDPMAVLKLAISGFMMLELAALRRVATGVGNMVLEQQQSSETFLAKPFRYNLAIFAVALFGAVEFFAPQSAMLGWLGLAAMAFTLGAVNDYFLEETHLFKAPIMIYLFLIALLLAAGYGAMGAAHLLDRPDTVETLRHLLTTGVFGLSIYVVMLVVGRVHTGREMETTAQMGIGVALILAAVFVRVYLPLAGVYSPWIHTVSALLWSAPFLWYLRWFGKILLSPRADGLPG